MVYPGFPAPSPQGVRLELQPIDAGQLADAEAESDHEGRRWLADQIRAEQGLAPCTEPPSAAHVLELMLELPGLRDRIRAVVAIAPEFPRGEPWLVEHFRHHLLDTELARRTAWIALQWVAGDTEQGRRIIGTPLPSPPPDPQEREGVELLDLGLVHEPSPAALSLLSSALMLTVTQWLSLRS